MAAGALQFVGHGSGLVDIFADGERRLLHLVVNASAERHVNDVCLKRKGLVGDRDGWVAELEISPSTNEKEDQGEDEAEEKLQESTRTTRTRPRLRPATCHVAFSLALPLVVYFADVVTYSESGQMEMTDPPFRDGRPHAIRRIKLSS